MNDFRKQRGLTLIEVIVSLGIIASITAGLVALSDQSSKDTRAAVTALHLKTVGNAANEYIKDNYATVAGIATAAAPALIRVSDLVAGGYLGAGFSVKNARQQDTCVLVLQPTANNLVGMVVTEGGDTIDDLTLGQVAATVGGAGGGIYSTATTTFRGSMGGWSVPVGSYANANHLGQKCNGTAGVISLAAGHPVMAVWLDDGSAFSSTLYRSAVPGSPGMNTMQTPILMGAGTVQVEKDPCTSTGALGRDASGKILSCQAGLWEKQGGGSAYWGDPVDQAAAMPACNATNANETRVRYGYATAPTRRLFTCDGTTWEAVGVDHAGGLVVPGALKSDTLQPTYVATEGASDAKCNADGTTWGKTAKDATGLLLSCQSGVWHSEGIGVAQTWQNMLGSALGCAGPRALGVSCTNATGKPILVSVSLFQPGGSNGHLAVNGIIVQEHGASTNTYFNLDAIVPNGGIYQVNVGGGGSINRWAELR